VLGNLIRLLVLAAWLAVTGVFVHQRLGLGHTPAGDPGAVLERRIDRTLVYDLSWRPSQTAAWERSGSCRVGARNDDAGLRATTEIVITNQRLIPGAQLIKQFLGAPGGAASRDIQLRLDQLLDTRMRLRGIELEGRLFGVPFSGKGMVDHRGLQLDWKAADKEGSNLLPDVRDDPVSGGELAAGLPPGLRPGARFTSRISSIDATRLKIATKDAVFIAHERAPGETAGGVKELLEVEMRVDDRLLATLWCDEEGTVYRQVLHDQGLQLELLRITDASGKRLWPAPVASPVPAASGSERPKAAP